MYGRDIAGEACEYNRLVGRRPTLLSGQPRQCPRLPAAITTPVCHMGIKMDPFHRHIPNYQAQTVGEMFFPLDSTDYRKYPNVATTVKVEFEGIRCTGFLP